MISGFTTRCNGSAALLLPLRMLSLMDVLKVSNGISTPECGGRNNRHPCSFKTTTTSVEGRRYYVVSSSRDLTEISTTDFFFVDNFFGRATRKMTRSRWFRVPSSN